MKLLEEVCSENYSGDVCAMQAYKEVPRVEHSAAGSGGVARSKYQWLQ
jgi:hypothetical protein